MAGLRASLTLICCVVGIAQCGIGKKHSSFHPQTHPLSLESTVSFKQCDVVGLRQFSAITCDGTARLSLCDTVVRGGSCGLYLSEGSRCSFSGRIEFRGFSKGQGIYGIPNFTTEGPTFCVCDCHHYLCVADMIGSGRAHIKRV